MSKAKIITIAVIMVIAYIVFFAWYTLKKSNETTDGKHETETEQVIDEQSIDGINQSRQKDKVVLIPPDPDNPSTLDSVVKYLDENGNYHVQVWARDFPIVGDTGVEFVFIRY